MCIDCRKEKLMDYGVFLKKLIIKLLRKYVIQIKINGKNNKKYQKLDKYYQKLCKFNIYIKELIFFKDQ